MLFAEVKERNSLEFKQSQINFTMLENISLGGSGMQQFSYDGEATIYRPMYNDVRVKSHFT